MTKLPLALLVAASYLATAAAKPGEHRSQAADAILLTVVLRHDQSRSLDEIQKLEEAQGFYKSSPPAGTSVHAGAMRRLELP